MSFRSLVAGFAIACFVGSNAFSDGRRRNGPVPPMPGLFTNGMCWKQPTVEIKFNKDLDPMLDAQPLTDGGGAKERWAAMEQAVDEWNKALQKVGARLRLKLKEDQMAWAARQGKEKCEDPDTRQKVYSPDYTTTHVDKTNAGSTAARTQGKGPGPGWIVGDAVESYAIDSRLAETKLTPDPDQVGATEITEADILYFTHVMQGNCPGIEWGYHYKKGPTRGYYDFYSVMLHEIGHLLGLDHQDCPQRAPKIDNVMQASINRGARNAILDCELRTLAALYAPGGRCHPPAAPAAEGKRDEK